MILLIKFYCFYYTNNGDYMEKIKDIRLDKVIIISILIFMVISCSTIYSAMTYLPDYLGNLALKQLLFYILGFVALGFIVFLPNKWIEKVIFPLYIMGNILLLLLLFFGKSINGSKCWFIIPGIGSFQPSEFMKVILILVVALEVSKFYKEGGKSIKSEFKFLVRLLIIVGIPSILTFLEPDTGAVIIYSFITLGILLVCPLKRRWFIISLFVFCVIGGGFLYLYFFESELFVDIVGTDLFYRIDRILDWRNGEGMQLENSLTAIGSSGFFGHGYNKTPLYFPEAGTDFIFAVFASNFGLIPSILFLMFLTFFDTYLLSKARYEKNSFYKYILVGTVSMFLYQQVQNISMTFGLLPITGITLPFISYGGSSLLSYFIILGIILNFTKKEKKAIYASS